MTGRLRTNQRQRANQLRRMIERLGPAYVKVAQVLEQPYVLQCTFMRASVFLGLLARTLRKSS